MPFKLTTSVSIALIASFVMFLWAICFPLITIGLTSSPPMTFAFYRAAIAGLVLLSISTLLRRPKIKGSKNWLAILLIGLTATSVGFFGMFNGGKLVSPGIATVVSNIQPLIAAILAVIFLSEKLRRLQIFGIVLGFMGIFYISMPELHQNQSNLSGIGYILFSALAIATSNILLKLFSLKLDALTAMGWQLLIGSIPLGILARTTESSMPVEWSFSFVVTLLTLSLFGTALPFILWFKLLAKSELSELNVYTFLTPVFGIAMGVLFYNELLNAWDVIGVTVITISIALVSLLTPKHSN